MTQSATDTADRGIASVNQRFSTEPRRLHDRLWRWTLRLAGQVRRQYLSRLRPGYVARMRALRRGECRLCGSCCDLTFHCPFLNGEWRCRAYDTRTLTCRDFPVDATDLRLTRVPCGHYFAPPAQETDRAPAAH